MEKNQLEKRNTFNFSNHHCKQRLTRRRVYYNEGCYKS